MIDSASGDVLLDTGDSFGGRTTEPMFLASQLGQRARNGLSNAGYRWYHMNAAISGTNWLVALGFHGARLEFASFSLTTDAKSWDDWDMQDELRTADTLKNLLGSWLKCAATTQTPFADIYSFAWGRVSGGFSAQDATASISIHYEEPRAEAD